MSKNIAFVGGGTGGHVFPIKSMIEYLYLNNLDLQVSKIYWIGESNSLEQKICHSLSDEYLISFLPIFSGKLRRYFGIKPIFLNIIDIFKFMFGIIQSLFIIIKYKIEIIFCKGGYVCLPVVLAARLLGKKIYVHESDSVAGLTNKIAARFATKNFVGFDGVLPNSFNVGQILSNELLNFDDSLFTTLKLENRVNILIFGGSQGSRVLYNSVIELLKCGLLSGCNVFVVLGLKNLDLKQQFLDFNNVFVYDFLTQNQIGYIYSITDVCLTRGGATSLSELKAFGVKLIIVPLPFTGGNHQYYNAKEYVRQYNDFLVEQNQDLTMNLSKVLSKLNSYKKKQVLVNDLQENIGIIFKEILK